MNEAKTQVPWAKLFDLQPERDWQSDPFPMLGVSYKLMCKYHATRYFGLYLLRNEPVTSSSPAHAGVVSFEAKTQTKTWKWFEPNAQQLFRTDFGCGSNKVIPWDELAVNQDVTVTTRLDLVADNQSAVPRTDYLKLLWQTPSLVAQNLTLQTKNKPVKVHSFLLQLAAPKLLSETKIPYDSMIVSAALEHIYTGQLSANTEKAVAPWLSLMELFDFAMDYALYELACAAAALLAKSKSDELDGGKLVLLVRAKARLARLLPARADKDALSKTEKTEKSGVEKEQAAPAKAEKEQGSPAKAEKSEKSGVEKEQAAPAKAEKADSEKEQGALSQAEKAEKAISATAPPGAVQAYWRFHALVRKIISEQPDLAADAIENLRALR